MSQRFVEALVLVASVGGSQVCYAQTPATTFGRSVVLYACPQMVQPTLASPFLQPIQSKRSVQVEAICQCAADATFQDAKLAKFSAASEGEVRKAMQDPMVQSYFLGRALQATMRCTAVELDALLGEQK